VTTERDDTRTGPVSGLDHALPEPPDVPNLEVLGLIGHGGMGVVYRARQVSLDRLVALKVMRFSTEASDDVAERFAREARTLARLNHPNIVTVHDFGRAGELYYLLMEYVDGPNLRQALSSGQLTASEALSLLPRVCEALQHAHDEGVIHRDVKPENILIDGRGRVKVADFGLAKLGPATGQARLTQAQQVMGTAHYRSPEQVARPLEVDHRADIFSLGVVIYELLTGELPLGRFPLPSQRADIDPQLDAVVMRALESMPDARQQKVSELQRELEDIVGRARVEYRSRRTVAGWPLVHIVFGADPRTGRRVVARGVIAVGERAVGVVALGAVACGGLAVGPAAIGIVAFGAVAAGLLLAVGAGAVGGIAVGVVALGLYADGLFSLSLLRAALLPITALCASLRRS
jgi:predicted Ser/Thr protein kinase